MLMTESRCQIHWRTAFITLGILALLLYGSFYPFEFHASDPLPQLLKKFWRTAHDPLDRGDVISNVLLYLPLGFFAARSFTGAPALRAAAVAAAGSLLAVAIEITQFYDFYRAPSLLDAAPNALGATVGAIAGVRIRRHINAPLILLAAWFGARLLPYIPSVDVHKYVLAIRPLFAASSTPPLELFRYFALWLGAAALMDAMLGAERSRRVLIASIAAVFAARIVIAGTTLTIAETGGAALAAIAWIAIGRTRFRMSIVCVIFAAFLIEDALRPFEFDKVPRPFGWLPFRSFIDGPREGASRVFLEKSFIYGAMLWLLRRIGTPLAIATTALFVVVFGLRVAQTYLPGRSAEITDPIMVLILAGLIALLDE